MFDRHRLRVLSSCYPPFECPRASQPGGVLRIVTEASNLTDSYLDTLFAPFEGGAESTFHESLDHVNFDGNREELDRLDHQIGITRMQVEILRLSLERARERHAELEVSRIKVVDSSNLLLDTPDELLHPEQVCGTNPAGRLPAEIISKIFSFLLELNPSQSLREDKTLETYFHSASVLLPHKLFVTPLGDHEDMHRLHKELSDRGKVKFDVHISPPSKPSNHDTSGHHDTVGFALTYPHNWFGLMVQGMSLGDAVVVLRRCEQVLPELRQLRLQNSDFSHDSRPLSPWSEGCEPVAQRLWCAEVEHAYLPLLGGRLTNVEELTVVMLSSHHHNPNTNIYKNFHSLRNSLYAVTMTITFFPTMHFVLISPISRRSDWNILHLKLL
ncbi:hypothetical protein BD410DRAFT_786450 [Rickenella mellea]|uniref:Uncharacterized protein n=1 Tax=Rickenella mellea TaxID=50990 RepID=A0A4Y7QAS6_9AGAM|nr:hypothetical protein BD410DRAFT_786450 [Rickenella mellea]